MPDPKDDPKSSGWRAYIFARDQWHCRICAVTASCTRRWYANTLLMSTTKPCRRACMSTSTAQFGSERNSRNLAVHATRIRWEAAWSGPTCAIINLAPTLHKGCVVISCKNPKEMRG
jgi:hypothetical protein